MNKDERLNLKSILMINALVKFNLIPPQDSAEWKQWHDRYEAISIHLCPLENFDSSGLKRIMELLSQSSMAKTPNAKLKIYKEICELTGFTIEQVACPMLHNFDTLTSQCSYNLFENSKSQPTQYIPTHLEDDIKQWYRFNNALPKFYLWDAHKDNELTSASIVAAAFCLALQDILSEEAQLSCLYALAKILERDDFIQSLDEMDINAEKIPQNLKLLYTTFLSSKIVNLENKHIEATL